MRTPQDRSGRGGPETSPDVRPGPDDGAAPDTGDGAWWAGDEDGPGGSADPGTPTGSRAADAPAAAPLPPLPPSTRERRPRDPWIPEAPPFRALSGPDIAGIVLLGALGIGVLVVLGLFVLSRFDQRDPVAAPVPVTAPARPTAAVTPSGPAPTPSPAAASPGAAGTPAPTRTAGPVDGTPYAGPLVLVGVRGATASCPGDPSVDGSGNVVEHTADLAVDGDPATSWACRGRGVGRRLTITLDGPTSIAQVGMVNGWVRRDPGVDRYLDDRRVTRVRWTFDGGAYVDQTLDPHDRDPQTLAIPPTTTTRVVVEIRGTSSGRRDVTSIGDIAFAGPAGG